MSLLSWLKIKNETVVTKNQSEFHTAIKSGQADVDRTILEQLRKVGVDLSAPMHIRYIFTAPAQDSARQLAQELEARGLHPEVTAEGGRWKVAAPADVVLTDSGMTAQRAEFTSLASNFGGQYFGWELKAKQTKTVKLS